MNVQVRSVGLDGSDALHVYAEKRFCFALDRVLSPGDVVTVRISDVNGPKGGTDKLCRIVIRSKGRRATVQAKHVDPYAAVDDACSRAAEVMRRRHARLVHDRRHGPSVLRDRDLDENRWEAFALAEGAE